MITSLVQPLYRSHGTLDEERSYILPVLLQQRHQEVYRQEDILSQFILGHLDMTDSDSQTEDLLHLELDGSLDVVDFVHHLLILVQLLQSFYIHVRDVVGFRLVTMGFVTKNTDLQLGSRDVLQFDGTTETLVSLRIVILESNLQFHGLQEVP